MHDRPVVEAVIADYRTAPISDRDRALFAFLDQVTHDSPGIVTGDVERVRAAGWSEEAIYDAITVCALFNFYNRWCDAAGVHDLSEFGYEMTGRRIATAGYTSSLPPPRP